VTAFTSSESKFDEARGFGAHHVVSSRDSAAINKLAGSFDLLISTVNVPLDWDAMVNSLAPNGRLHNVGAVLQPIPVSAFSLIAGQRSVSGSPTGSPVDIEKMLDFSKQHKTIDGFPGGEPLENDQLFALDVEVLVPAALENQITMENAPTIRAKIVAVTDWKGGVYNDKGLDVAAMIEYVKQHRTVAGFTGGDKLDPANLFGLDVDILVPAALENQITMENAPSIKAKIIAEGANGPTTPDAHKHLHERGVFVIPDILANAGGVTTSYFEWVQDRHGYFWEEEEVNRRLEQKMVEAFKAVLDMSIRYKTDMRTAAYIVAINRVATVTRMRGMYA